jgi:hypothetical protein
VQPAVLCLPFKHQEQLLRDADCRDWHKHVASGRDSLVYRLGEAGFCLLPWRHDVFLAAIGALDYQCLDAWEIP